MRRARPTNAHPRRRWLVVAVVALVLVGGGGALAWGLTRGTSTPAATERTVTASRETVKETVGATGTVEPARRADLTFGASGTVTSVEVAVGDSVAKGDVLATLDDDDLQADLDAAQAELESARDDLTTAEDDTTSTTAELNAAKAKVATDESAVSTADTALDAAKLRATFAGTVAEVGVAKGDTVGSGSSGSGSSGSGSSGSGSSGSGSASSGTTAAVTVISTDRYTVSAAVGSADLAKVKKGLQAQITTAGSTATVFGTVSSVAVMASTGTSGGTGTGTTTMGGTATFPVTVAVTGTRKDLYAGASATVSIIVSQRDDVLTVPTAAVSTANGQTVVTRLVGTAKVPTPVTLGTSYGATTEVTKGLAEGDQVVVTVAARTPGGTASGRTATGTGGYGGYGGGTGGGGFGGGGLVGGGTGTGTGTGTGRTGGTGGTGGGTR
ncbi:efflux RND transporter periplasmic adaptor subunit [Microlunatus spumicola]|uniref:Efflux RND transporter periplasmic adaptor subunit n=1 Tax=Microlunatus spumicola TaxID=81499 RepID=A0ABP6XTP1_9ACTN